MSQAPTAPRRPARGKPRGSATAIAAKPSELLTALPVTLQDVYQAKLRIAPHLWRTSLLPSATLSRMTGATLRIKTENLQRTCSFKARGALNAVLLLTDEERGRGVCTFSAGNHGQGLAFAAQLAGVRCTVFLAKDASRSKIQAIKGYGAEVVYGTTIGDASDRMELFRQESGARYISPFGEAAVVAGQGTVGLEILEDFPEVEHVVLGIGGGGLAAGVAVAVKSIRPEVRITGAEPEGAPTLTRALAAGEPVRLGHIETVADGLSAPYTSPIPFEIVRALVDEVVIVSDSELIGAMRLLLSRCKLLVEPSGSAAVAALLAERIPLAKGANTVAVLSGGNVDMGVLKRLL